MARLWVHECFRVFSDRLVGDKDHDTFLSLLSEKLGSHFDLTYHNLCPNKQAPLFGNWIISRSYLHCLIFLPIVLAFFPIILPLYLLSSLFPFLPFLPPSLPSLLPPSIPSPYLPSPTFPIVPSFLSPIFSSHHFVPPSPLVDFLKPDAVVYEDILKFPELKKFSEEKLEDYNMEPGVIPMSLVLFRDAIEHGGWFLAKYNITKQ